jgi:hypothetical protein
MILLKTPARQENFKKSGSLSIKHPTLPSDPTFKSILTPPNPPKVQALSHPNQLSTVDIYDFTTILHIYVGF